MLKLEDVQKRICYYGWQIGIQGNTVENITRRGIPVKERKIIRTYVKGLKMLLREAQHKGAFEIMGGAIHHNINTPKEKYHKLCNSLEMVDICKIGNGASFFATSYVDGSYTVAVED